jgi:hypothetical protein
MKVDKIEAFDYMLHLFEEWRDKRLRASRFLNLQP